MAGDADDLSAQDALRLHRDAARLVASVHAQISPLELEKRAIAPTFLVQRDEWASYTSKKWMEENPTNAVVQIPAELIRHDDGDDEPVLGLRGYVLLCCAVDGQFERRYVEEVHGVLFSFENEPVTDEDRMTLARGALELRSVELIRPVKGDAETVCGPYGIELVASERTWQIAFETALQYRRSLQMLCGFVEASAVSPWLRVFLESADTTNEASIKIRPSTTVGEVVMEAFESFAKHSGAEQQLLPHVASEYVIKIPGYCDFMLDSSRPLREHLHMNEHWRMMDDLMMKLSSLRLTLVHKSQIDDAVARSRGVDTDLWNMLPDQAESGETNSNDVASRPATPAAATEDGITSPSKQKKRPRSDSIDDAMELSMMLGLEEEWPEVMVVFEVRRDILLHPLSSLSAAKKTVLWTNREQFKDQYEALPRILRCVDWSNQDHVDDVLLLLPKWTAPSHPAAWMELLRPEFTHDAVRSFAVQRIDEIPDATFSLILPQLVQALKFESCCSSPLALLLIKRGLLNPMQIGIDLFWLLKVETYSPQYRDLYDEVLNVYVDACGPTVRRIFKTQDALFSDNGIFHRVWLAVSEHKEGGLDILNRVLGEELSALKESLPKAFQLPIYARTEVRRLLVDKCRVLQSPNFDLLLVFKNADEAVCEPISMIFRCGEDLRQERFTVQLIRLIDEMWRHDRLDVAALPLRCVATSPCIGLIEVVTDAISAAEVREGCGVMSVREDKPSSALEGWLAAHNPDQTSKHAGFLRYLRSCEGWTTALSVLGIDDRNDEHTMVTTGGRIFYVNLSNLVGERTSEQDPEGLQQRREFASTQAMVNAIFSSSAHAVKESADAYISIRHHIHLMVLMLELMADTNSNGDGVHSFVSALKPELTEVEARDSVARTIYERLGLEYQPIVVGPNVKEDVPVARIEGTTTARQLLCGFWRTVCLDERATKPNGSLHPLCEQHRYFADKDLRMSGHRRTPARRAPRSRKPKLETKPETKTELQGGDGFLAANATYGVWSEATLVTNRFNSGDVQVLQQLSRGRYGELWVGSIHDKRIAIKRLAIGDQTKANALAFGSEIELMTKLQHPKLVAFIGVEWVKEWEAQVVTEFMPHGDLRTLLDAQQQIHEIGRLTWMDFKCQVAIDVVDALVYLLDRSPRVCIQTLKARNVLLEADPGSEDGYGGGAKLSLYAAARARPVLSASDADESSLRWLAPELAVSGSSWTDRATIYSFGVFLSEMDTSKLPYHDAVNPNGSAMSSFKILQLVSQGKLRPSLSEDCPEAIAAVIRQCLAQDPSQRPSAAQLAFQLRYIRKNEL